VLPVSANVPTLLVNRLPFLIGRHADCDFVVADRQVSRQHCRFHLRGRMVFVEDLGSNNGTFVNGQRVRGGPFVVESGDVVRVGEQWYKVVIDHPQVSNEPFGR
jgi:pSer/pThr/pTyr-binding forkhead associated (FHA) protein